VLREHAPVSLQIFNIGGALVRTLVDGDLDAGVHERRWNGRDSFGHAVASGTYFYRLRLGAEVLNGRLDMVK
jgi:flagellar hook assembly protein FlgD